MGATEPTPIDPAPAQRVHITARLDAHTHAQLTEFARLDRRRVTDLIRIALEDYVKLRTIRQVPIPFDDDASVPA